MILREIIEAIRTLLRIHTPYVARKGPGRWTIREYDEVVKRWTDSGQTFFHRRSATMRLKDVRGSVKKRAS